MPSRAITGRWLGARPPVTAIWIAIELKLAKPHSMKVTTAMLAGDRPDVGSWLNATNSFSTTLVFMPMRVRNIFIWRTVVFCASSRIT